MHHMHGGNVCTTLSYRHCAGHGGQEEVPVGRVHRSGPPIGMHNHCAQAAHLIRQFTCHLLW